MSHFRSAADDSFGIRYVWRGSRWVAEVERRPSFWPTLFEWALVTALACLIVTMGPIVGYLSVKPALDRESRAFATDSVRGLKGASVSAETCSGHSWVTPFSADGLITARYLCELKRGERRALAALTLRDEPDSWKIIGVYVQP